MSVSPPAPAWSLDGLRLPKAIESDARGPALHASLRESSGKLWPQGTIVVPTAPWRPALAALLASVHREGQLVRGLEAIEKSLDRQAHGLSLVDARSSTERGSRVSRLVLLGNDGAERFYRQAERLVCTQAPRVLAIRVDATSTQLAEVVPEANGVVRALMVEHKASVAQVLLALYAAS
jgi:hypothetical protein